MNLCGMFRLETFRFRIEAGLKFRPFVEFNPANDSVRLCLNGQLDVRFTAITCNSSSRIILRITFSDIVSTHFSSSKFFFQLYKGVWVTPNLFPIFSAEPPRAQNSTTACLFCYSVHFTTERPVMQSASSGVIFSVTHLRNRSHSFLVCLHSNPPVGPEFCLPPFDAKLMM